jgi:hypothetical protein
MGIILILVKCVHNKTQLFPQIIYFFLPEGVASPIGEVPAELKIVHLAAAPGKKVDHSHGAQGFDTSK